MVSAMSVSRATQYRRDSMRAAATLECPAWLLSRAALSTASNSSKSARARPGRMEPYAFTRAELNTAAKRARTAPVGRSLVAPSSAGVGGSMEKSRTE